MKKKKIMLIVVLSIFAILIVTLTVKRINKQYKNVSDFSSVRELIEYYGCTYIKTNKSDEEGYYKDIYIKFKLSPIDENEQSNRATYETIISLVEAKMDNKNIRIIDESRNIIIRIKYNQNTQTANYTINNTNNYFENLISLQSIQNYKEEKYSNMTIKSDELISIAKDEWSKKKINLGTIDSTCDKYDIYFDEGYKVRTISNKIYNIIFTKQYQKEVLENVKTGMTNSEVEENLGTPTYKDNINDMIGYKSNEIYAFFYDGEISIYRVEKLDKEKNEQFATLVTNLNKTGDYNTFLDNLTDLYPDYDTYYRDENYTKIAYPLMGMYITFGASINNGITIYENYQGKITEDISIDDVISNKILPSNISLNLNQNFAFEKEQSREYSDYMKRYPDVCELETKTYSVYMVKDEKCTFYSKDKKNIDSEINSNKITNIKQISNNCFTFGIKDDGIYIYNAQTLQKYKIVNGKGEFNITNVTDNEIYYNSTSIKYSVKD